MVLHTVMHEVVSTWMIETSRRGKSNNANITVEQDMVDSIYELLEVCMGRDTAIR